VVGQDVGAIRKHIALIGFMGAGKSTIGRDVAELTGRRFLDIDAKFALERGMSVEEAFEREGEDAFRTWERCLTVDALRAGEPAVIAPGGGAVTQGAVRKALREHAFTVFLDVDVATAWERSRNTGRPLARDEAAFRRLYDERRPLYENAADAVARDAEAILLASLAIAVARGARPAVDQRVAVVADERVVQLHTPPLSGPLHLIPAGERAKTLSTVDRLWGELDLDRSGSIVAFGGGSTTDVAGYVAATYLRGVPWLAIPTTLVGQVDAAIGGKTGINLDKGKNLVGAFHFPAAVMIDPEFLTTLPDEERHAGMAEVVKTGLLAGREVWTLPEEEMIRACAAFKSAVVLSDPYETKGRRTILNLGHTFAHALETGSGYTVPHGDAVALGLLAALRLSGQPTAVVEEVLRPEPVWADPDAAWAALKRDKKGEGVFVLLEAPGKPVVTTVPDADARKALEALIQK
jgi:shikimate kinase/3-dehydroquinate synthase